MSSKFTKKKDEQRRIIGIDPGYGRVGVAILEGGNDVWRAMFCSCIETNPALSFVERLAAIEQELCLIVDKYKPDAAAVETLFFNKNTKTAIQVSQARGALLHILHKKGMSITELSPLQVKQAITGYGRATKEQVQKLLCLRLNLADKKIQDDAADALAIAFACALMALPTSDKR